MRLACLALWQLQLTLVQELFTLGSYLGPESMVQPQFPLKEIGLLHLSCAFLSCYLDGLVSLRLCLHVPSPSWALGTGCEEPGIWNSGVSGM